MAVPEDTVESILRSAERRERQSRQRALLYTAIPILLAVALVVFTALQIQRLSRVQSELNSTEEKLAQTNQQLVESQERVSLSEAALNNLKDSLEQAQRDYQQAVTDLEAKNQELTQANTALELAQERVTALEARIEELEQELQELTDLIHEASTFKRFEVAVDLEGLKAVELPGPQVDLLYELLSLQYSGVRFDRSGSSLEEGINSPNFAALMLDQHGLLPDGYDFEKPPWAQLPQIPEPQDGDLVYYESGYTMFYFSQPEEFVIGMTPVGVLTLKPDFAPIVGTLNVEYP